MREIKQGLGNLQCPPKRTIIIAGNKQEFDVYKRFYAADFQESLIYASSVESLLGVEAIALVLVGTYYKREDFSKLERAAISRINN